MLDKTEKGAYNTYTDLRSPTAYKKPAWMERGTAMENQENRMKDREQDRLAELYGKHRHFLVAALVVSAALLILVRYTPLRLWDIALPLILLFAALYIFLRKPEARKQYGDISPRSEDIEEFRKSERKQLLEYEMKENFRFWLHSYLRGLLAIIGIPLAIFGALGYTQYTGFVSRIQEVNQEMEGYVQSLNDSLKAAETKADSIFEGFERRTGEIIQAAKQDVQITLSELSQGQLREFQIDLDVKRKGADQGLAALNTRFEGIEEEIQRNSAKIRKGAEAHVNFLAKERDTFRDSTYRAEEALAKLLFQTQDHVEKIGAMIVESEKLLTIINDDINRVNSMVGKVDQALASAQEEADRIRSIRETLEQRER